MVTRTVSYDKYGAVATDSGSGTSAIGYTGSWTDPTSGLVYLRARDYDPATGQFLSVDPLVDQTHQPYTYVGNNPLNATDPTGLCGTMGNDFSAGCNTFWGNWEKMFNSALTSPTANAVTNVLTTGVTGHIATTLEGIGDGASLGLTALFRNAVGVDCHVQKDGFYYGGMVTGVVATTIVSGGASTAGETTEASSAVAEEAAAARGGVYSLRDEAGSVVRTGRAKVLEAPRMAHANDPVLGEFRFNVEYRTDVYAEQRGLEQILYENYPGARAVNGGYNKIGAISLQNPNLDYYMQSASDYLNRLGGH